MEKIITVIKDISPIITVIISSLVSYFVARAKAKSEVNKLLITLSHEDQTTFSNTFRDLLSYTLSFCQFPNGYVLEDAVKANSAFLTIAPDEFHPILSNLDHALNEWNVKEIQKLRKELISLYSKWIEQGKQNPQHKMHDIDY